MPWTKSYWLFMAPLSAVIVITAVIIILPASAQTPIAPNHPYIRYWGRIDRRKPQVVRFDWPGIMIEACFEGTSCTIGFEGSCEFYNVFIDGRFTHRFKADSLQRRYELASGLTDTVHHLLVTKRYETSKHVTLCTGLAIDDGRRLRPLPPAPGHRIEFIGSSTLIGYGNEAKTTQCDSVSELTNCYLSYGPVAARLLDAEYVMCAITSRGLVRNYHSPFMSSFRPFPAYYHRTLWTDPESPRWNHDALEPDVIVISLGTNDFSTRPYPPKDLFLNRYYSFIKELSMLHPEAHIVCLASSREPFRTYVKDFVGRETGEGNRRISFFTYERVPEGERGCHWHPNVKAHQRIAEKLAAFIRPILEGKDRTAPPVDPFAK
ncbi:MAG: hypothetical protein JXA18_16295 [Chitinispirillaceae bacterium]|nr:hypothetical protein [Chitinispirillaceae bacterium]